MQIKNLEHVFKEEARSIFNRLDAISKFLFCNFSYHFLGYRHAWKVKVKEIIRNTVMNS